MIEQCWWCLASVEPYEESEQRFCAVCEKFAKENW